MNAVTSSITCPGNTTPQGEVAELLRLSPRTVERDWLKARLFLLRQLELH
jgi:hypothetical protein